jgi:hypothetical protein
VVILSQFLLWNPRVALSIQTVPKPLAIPRGPAHYLSKKTSFWEKLILLSGESKLNRHYHWHGMKEKISKQKIRYFHSIFKEDIYTGKARIDDKAPVFRVQSISCSLFIKQSLPYLCKAELLSLQLRNRIIVLWGSTLMPPNLEIIFFLKQTIEIRNIWIWILYGKVCVGHVS